MQVPKLVEAESVQAGGTFGGGSGTRKDVHKLAEIKQAIVVPTLAVPVTTNLKFDEERQELGCVNRYNMVRWDM